MRRRLRVAVPGLTHHAKDAALSRTGSLDPAGCLQSPPPQFLGWAEIIDQSPADITLWLLPKDVPPPSPTKAFPDQPPSLPFLSHASHLLKEPRESSVSAGGRWTPWQKYPHTHRHWLFPTPHWGARDASVTCRFLPCHVSTVRGVHVPTGELLHHCLHLSRLKK